MLHMQQVAAIYVDVVVTCTASLSVMPWGRASAPPLGQMRQMAAPA